MIFVLDAAAMVTALAAAVLWWMASRANLRRVAKDEEFDHHDVNRLIVAFNRTQRINARAALAASLSALCIALRFGAGLL